MLVHCTVGEEDADLLDLGVVGVVQVDDDVPPDGSVDDELMEVASVGLEVLLGHTEDLEDDGFGTVSKQEKLDIPHSPFHWKGCPAGKSAIPAARLGCRRCRHLHSM